MAFLRAALLFSATQLVIVDANAFMGMTQRSEVEAALSIFASDASAAATKSVEGELRPMYATLPKNEHGKLDPPVVRYALSRYFAKKYGWHLKGLEAAGGSWDAASPAAITKDQVPSYIQSLFEQQMNSRGLGLEGLAVFAQTLVDLIYKEVDDQTLHLWGAMGLKAESVIEKSQLHKVMMLFLSKSINGKPESSGTLEEFEESLAFLVENLLAWKLVETWADDMQGNFAFMQRSVRNPFTSGFDYAYTLSLLKQMSREYGYIQNLECREHKDMLIDLEDAGTGRVRLPRFYSNATADENWPFTEKSKYLSTMGALDETNASKPAVLITNYLYLNSNCVGSGGLFSVCCIDECDGLLSQVERACGHPQGDVARITEVVSNMPSDTVDAPRNLSTLLLSRLDEIAAHHGGHVPLHGRLFQQWLHHAFPHECAFPHVSGTTSPMYPNDWISKNEEEDMFASDEELEMHMASDIPEISVSDLPWHAVEELVATHKYQPGQAGTSSSLRTGMLLIAAASSVVPLLHYSKLVGEGPADCKVEKHSV